MKRLSRMLGVTLLEIMLVLAIAAMIILMSIRYYNAATAAQQSNGVIGQLEAIAAAADNLAVAKGGYSGITSSINSIVGSNNTNTPWGQYSITATGSMLSTSYLTITQGNMPASVCNLVGGKLIPGTGANLTGTGNRWSGGSSCTTNANPCGATKGLTIYYLGGSC